MKIEFIPHPDATPEDFKHLAHVYGVAAYFLTKAIHCTADIGESVLADLASGEPPRPRKIQLDEAEVQGADVEHQRRPDDATNRRIELELSPDALDVVEQLRLLIPPAVVADVSVNGRSIHEEWEELDDEYDGEFE